MSRKLHAVEPLVEKFYPRFYDLNYRYAVARSRYRRWIRELLDQGGVRRVLDCGCGYHSVTAELIDQSKMQLIGIDVAFPALSANRAISTRAVADAMALPFENASFDVVVCESVLEHLLKPERFLQEALRVLRPRGKLMILTSGRWHPFMLINRLLSGRLAAGFLWRLLRRPLSSTFPAFYRCNSKRRLAQAAARAGFRVACLEVASGTFGYLRFSKWLIMLGIIFDRLTDNRLLDDSKIGLLAVLEKPRTSSE
jgi:SAM-dependent methyltransferase